MASLGAVRRYDGTNWHTIGHLILVVPVPAALTLLEAEAEDGQAVFCLSDNTIYTFNSVTGKHEAAEAAATLDPLFDNLVEPAAWDTASTYVPDEAVMHAGGYWITDANTVAGQEPGVHPSWRPLTMQELWRHAAPEPPAQDFSFTRDYVEGEFAWEATFLYRAMTAVPASLTYPSQDPASWEPVGISNPVALPFDPTYEYEQGEMAWDENHDELYVAITHVGASTTLPHTDRTNWRPVGLVPYTTAAGPAPSVRCRWVPRLEDGRRPGGWLHPHERCRQVRHRLAEGRADIRLRPVQRHDVRRPVVVKRWYRWRRRRRVGVQRRTAHHLRNGWRRYLPD